ncbi:RNase A-like domain-containing protein [Tenacibaculum jejuense]|uniref:Probable lipoprotein n=1 Tax=Tenacibaculum jejuense TaxID=584609 RepID=A0A238UAM7_9FLAO|nr:RNase A-like domain-containing protein [Tenacibaculum jejuense]SNR16219.1 Probable lipoprotein precursor [Tenacibaculum jejuense]
MKLFKVNYYLKIFLLGLFITTSFTSCQDEELVMNPSEVITPQTTSENTSETNAILTRGGSGFLITHENCGGHTIERHVNKSDSYLRWRLNNSSISAASTFYELNQAGQVIYNAINSNSSRVNNWLNGSGGYRLVLNYSHHRNIGKVLRRGNSSPYNSRRLRVVLERRNCSGYGYRILTAYPN